MGQLQRKSSQQEEAKAILAAQQDPKYFSVLYNRYYKPVFVFVYKRINNQEVTADVTSRVFLKALLNIAKYKDRGFPFSSWLFRIAVNEVNQYYRDLKKEATVSLGEMEVEHLVEDLEIENTERHQQLMVDALNELAEEDARLVELRFFEHLSFQEIGAIFGWKEANAKIKVYRILKKMKAFVKNQQQ